MEWKLISEQKLPIGNVLAANFDISDPISYKRKLYGRLFINESDDTITCKSDYDFDELLNCTHYIDIDKYDNERETV